MPDDNAGAAGTVDLGGDLTVNRLGFGAMRLTGPEAWGPPADRDEAKAVLRRAVELGVNFIDTADSYGPHISEELISEALYPYPDDLVIVGKGGRLRPNGELRPWPNDGSPEHLTEACEGSLRRLRLEQFPVYLLHHPDDKVPLEDSITALVALKAQGKIRHIGISNANEDQIRRAQLVTPIVVLQNRYKLDDRTAEPLIDLCEQESMVFMPFATIREVGAVATRIAQRQGVSPRQIALAWLLARSAVMAPIPGTSSVSHLEENIRAATIELTPADVAELSAASA